MVAVFVHDPINAIGWPRFQNRSNRNRIYIYSRMILILKFGLIDHWTFKSLFIFYIFFNFKLEQSILILISNFRNSNHHSQWSYIIHIIIIQIFYFSSTLVNVTYRARILNPFIGILHESQSTSGSGGKLARQSPMGCFELPHVENSIGGPEEMRLH